MKKRGEHTCTERCHACLMSCCTPCGNLNLQQGRKINWRHCEQHCRYKKERSAIRVGQGFDRRYARNLYVDEQETQEAEDARRPAKHPA